MRAYTLLANSIVVSYRPSVPPVLSIFDNLTMVAATIILCYYHPRGDHEHIANVLNRHLPPSLFEFRHHLHPAEIEHIIYWTDRESPGYLSSRLQFCWGDSEMETHRQVISAMAQFIEIDGLSIIDEFQSIVDLDQAIRTAALALSHSNAAAMFVSSLASPGPQGR